MNIFNDDSNFVYLLNAMGKKVLINGVEIQALISNQKDKVLDTKKIKTVIKFKTGDVVTYQGYSWLITSEVSKTNTIYKGYMRKCNNTLRYKASVDGVVTIISIPTIIDNGTVSVAEGKYINVADNTLACSVGYSMIDKIQYITEFNSATRFQINGRMWKTSGIDPITSVLEIEQGIIIIKLKNSDKLPEDDISVGGVAFNTPAIVITTPIGDNYTIELSTSNADIEQNKTFQITPTCRNNSTVITTPILTYVVADATICSVDSLGLVTALKVGVTVITVKFENVEIILNITITPIPTQKSYKIVTSTTQVDSDTISLGMTRTQKVVNSDLTVISNGSVVFTFSLEDSDKNPSVKAIQLISSIDSILATQCTLHPNTKNVLGYFWLVAETNGIITRRELRVKSLSGS
ncbi:hypothetical protein [Clostridium estertheticum]|uniref:hypothetical protein n=1 Tax=Clostridium estertheticum TaxID=238834 RepID=UPI00124CB4AD|nr:hypothetical protein [Clostridium estertheticum]MBZ9616802.1 hypothetical protein [Clostridium estertheticum subsp. laramiense]WAG72509.1 hypothetical protein LL032_15290 [Clostridium estertheticum]